MKSLLHILPATQLDKKKWDNCVNESANGLIYSSTIYLDAMSENWHGLIIDDYIAVMPLPWKRKYGIRYGYTPAFIQQLGVIGNITKVDLTEILIAIHSFYSFADIHFNFSNKAIQTITPAIHRTNLIIDLSSNYNSIQSHYKSDLKENIRKAGPLCYEEGDSEFTIELYKTYYSKRMRHITENDYEKFKGLCLLLQKKGQSFNRIVTDENKHILATAIFLIDSKRIYNLMNTTTNEGRHKEANHFLLDRVIREFTGQHLLFDFEGSELPGIKHFYKTFGAIAQPYFHYRYNGLPWPLRLFKR